jgi:hypothetical protein
MDGHRKGDIRQRGRQAWIDKGTDRRADIRQTDDRQMNRQVERPIDRQMNGQTGQIHRKAESRKTGRYTDV